MQSNVYIGQYSQKGHLGFSQVKFEANGVASSPSVKTDIVNPSYLTHSQHGLYVLSEVFQAEGAALYFLAHDVQYTQKIDLDGDAPCHIAISGAGDRIAVAHYGTGDFELFALGSEGKIGQRIAKLSNYGQGPHATRQLSPHGHQVMFIPNTTQLVTVDLGIDLLTFYHYEGKQVQQSQRLELPPGSGPRHASFTQDGLFGFVLCELDESLTVITLAEQQWQVVTTIAAFPEHVCHEAAAAIKLSADERYMYLTSRGESVISWFDVSEPKRPVYQGYVETGGAFPRDITITPDGKWLLAANQHSNNVSIFELDPQTGKPNWHSDLPDVIAPTCLVVSD
ncbi:lactonase family protein [Vibrio variabilis]|uniref:lactonase family protein n=1 Tax=Vibrio variabilis TaxID=990271 RepID=UPI000DD8C084|nr:beta-propeller fold lactonase family protein [Vibrio variabilis]